MTYSFLGFNNINITHKKPNFSSFVTEKLGFSY